jgi:hypothetical protein
MRQCHWLFLLLAALVVCGVGVALALSLNPDGVLEYKQEWIRAVLQASLVAVLGIVTSLVLERFKDTLQQRRDISKMRFDVRDELSRAYTDVKLIRRKLQQTGGSASAFANELNEIQVLVERHKRDNIRLFRQEKKLEEHLEKMEKYLNTVANKPKSNEHNSFTSSGFKEFAVQYERAASLISNEIGGQAAP